MRAAGAVDATPLNFSECHMNKVKLQGFRPLLKERYFIAPSHSENCRVSMVMIVVDRED